MTTWRVTAVQTDQYGDLVVTLDITTPAGQLVDDLVFRGRRSTTDTPVTDGVGRVQTPGGWVLPWTLAGGRWTSAMPADVVRQSVPWNVAASVTRHATDRAARAAASGHVGDHRHAAIRRGTADPHGVLAHAAGIVGLKGAA